MRRRKGHLITSQIEHSSVINASEQLEKEGFSVTYLSVDHEGCVDPDAVRAAIREDTCLISIMHANNEVGTLQPIAEIGAIAKEHGIAFHSDAVQSFTKENIHVDEMHIDMLSVSSHKVHGPKGVGALYVRSGITLLPLLFGGEHERKRRAGTENAPGIVGFAQAVELASQDARENMRHLSHLLTEGLLALGAKLNGSRDRRVCNNVNITFSGLSGEQFLYALNARGVYCSTGSACSSRMHGPSRVLLVMGLTTEEANGSLRFSLGRFNTEEEIQETLRIVAEIVAEMRAIRQ